MVVEKKNKTKLALPTKARFKFLGRKGKKSGGKIKVIGTSLVVQWLRFHASNASGEAGRRGGGGGVLSSIPGQGTKISHAVFL